MLEIGEIARHALDGGVEAGADGSTACTTAGTAGLIARLLEFALLGGDRVVVARDLLRVGAATGAQSGELGLELPAIILRLRQGGVTGQAGEEPCGQQAGSQGS